MTNNTTITLYRITASYERDGHTIDSTDDGTLGDDLWARFETEEDAQARADEMESEIGEYDLDPSTSYGVEPVTITISGVEAERLDDGTVEVSATVQTEAPTRTIVAVVYGVDAITGRGIHGLAPAGTDLREWTDADIIHALGERIGARVCKEILGMARTTATEAGLVVDPR